MSTAGNIDFVTTAVDETLATDSGAIITSTGQSTQDIITTVTEKLAPPRVIPDSPVNEIPTISVASNVVGAIIFVLLLLVVLLGLAVFLVVICARRRIKRRQENNTHQQSKSMKINIVKLWYNILVIFMQL